MKRYLLISFFLGCPLIWAGGDLSAQAEPDRGVKLDKEKWETLAKELDYQAPMVQKEEPEAPDPKKAMGWAIVLKVLAVLAVIGIIVLILFNLMGGASLFGPKNRKFGGKLEINLDNIEAHLPDADMPGFIRDALSAGDYKMAVRLHYLSLIQALARKEWIEWKRDKTNGDYLQEIQARPVFDNFRELTGVFERIWYGDYHLEEVAYRQVAGRFIAVEETLHKS
ncbi:MAG: DUF4129 domain-containing protein [Saprospirales bacterium]|nr:DUF4129 domain-containing protein [Saprospirales bacterium]MBK8490092.1 DUF4129 domain-containing protein [Saprospirales bacterium]